MPKQEHKEENISLIDIKKYIVKNKKKELINSKSIFAFAGIVSIVIILAVTVVILIYFFT